MFPFVDTKNQFHIDHVFPRTAFHAKKMKTLGFSAEESERLGELKERLSNLQLLEGPENQAKSGKMPAGWITEAYPDDTARKDYIARHMLNGFALNRRKDIIVFGNAIKSSLDCDRNLIGHAIIPS